MNKNILVTGSSGFIGTYLVNFLNKKNYNTLKLDFENVDILNKKEYFLSGRQIHVKDDYSKWTINDVNSDTFKLRRITNF